MALHNFIYEYIVKALKLPITPSANYGVILGTEGAIQATDVCQEVILTISYLTIINDFLPPHLGSAYAISGVAWLETLGKVQVDYQKS